MNEDSGLENLLNLDGETFFIDDGGKYWVKFEVKRCEITPERPFGIKYSLTLHDKNNERLVGFDNAHSVSQGSGPGAKRPTEFDHKHRLQTIKPHQYKDAQTLLEDFWNEVSSVLAQKGIEI